MNKINQLEQRTNRIFSVWGRLKVVYGPVWQRLAKAKREFGPKYCHLVVPGAWHWAGNDTVVFARTDATVKRRARARHCYRRLGRRLDR